MALNSENKSFDHAIQAKDLTYRYPGQEEAAVDGISLRIEKGMVTGLLGPNGAGKTTLIHLICHLLKPQSGQVTFPEKVLDKKYSIRQHTGFVPQQDGLFGELTLRENLRYFARLYLIPERSIRGKIEHFANFLQLSPHLDKRLRFFSGGMNRRANIIASLLHDPDIIILDEPTAGVDIQSRSLIHEVIKELRSRDKTILYTSHLLSEAEVLCDHIIILDQGKTIATGSPADLITHHSGSNLEDVFLKLTGKNVRD